MLIMGYACRIFTNDRQIIQDVNEYKIAGKDIKFVVDGSNNEYTLDDTQYVVVPTETLKQMIEQFNVNSQITKEFTKSKRGNRATLDTFDESMNAPETYID
jgi:hypothetical protein